MTRTGVFLALGLLAFTCAAAPTNYSGEAITGRVIDTRTNSPISAVAVLVQWQLIRGPEGAPFDLFHVDEAITDQDGRFTVRGWGPLARPGKGALDIYAPSLTFFKQGYRIKTISNFTKYAYERPTDEALRKSFWDGKTLELERADKRGSLDPGIHGASLLYGLGPEAGGCWWKHAPNFVRAVDAEVKQLRKERPGLSDSRTISRLVQRKACAPFDDFAKSIEDAK